MPGAVLGRALGGMSACVVIALANHKGGCGKTTSTANLGVALTERGLRVLLVDADPQANLSEAFAVPLDRRGLEHALAGDLDVEPIVVAAGLDVLATSETLVGVIAARAHEVEFAYALADVLERLRDRYGVILIDTPPGVGPLSTMALIAADRVIVPARPADFDVGGAIKLAEAIAVDLVEANSSLELLGVLLTQVDRRWVIGELARRQLAASGVRRLATLIPFAVSVGAAPREGAPTMMLRPDGSVARAYRQLAGDLLELLSLR